MDNAHQPDDGDITDNTGKQGGQGNLGEAFGAEAGEFSAFDGVLELEDHGAEDGGDGDGEAESDGPEAVQAEGERGGDGEAAAADAGQRGEALGDADEQGDVPGGLVGVLVAALEESGDEQDGGGDGEADADGNEAAEGGFDRGHEFLEDGVGDERDGGPEGEPGEAEDVGAAEAGGDVGGVEEQAAAAHPDLSAVVGEDGQGGAEVEHDVEEEVFLAG